MQQLSTCRLEHGAVGLDLEVPVDDLDRVQTLAISFSAGPTEALSSIELHADFILYCVEHGSPGAALAVFDAFCRAFDTAATDIHVVVQAQGLDEPAVRRVLKGYFSAWSIVTSQRGLLAWPVAPAPALFTDAGAEPAGLMALFGGQRGVGSYVDETVWLFDVYRPLLLDYVSHMSAFLHRESQDRRVSRVYRKGLNILQWLAVDGKMPDKQYILSMPVCLPLVGLTQLMHVMVLCKTLRVSPGELVRRFKVAVGHSQGIAIAAAFSLLTDEQSFYYVSERILGIQLLSGAFPQLRYPCYRLAASPVDKPRPMVSVQGIVKPELEQYIASFNSRQAESEDFVYLAVVNAADQFIVAGQINSTTSFVEYLCLESADPDKDRSRVPYSKRRPVINTQHTTISAPYHCALLNPVIDAIYTVAVEKQWLLHASDMQIAVQASDDGHDIRAETDLTKYLFTSICVLPVDWPLATQCAGISHIVDFGPGGLSGFGLLAYKNVEGLGVPVICAGALVSRSSKPYMGAKADLYKTDFADISVAPNWQTMFGPKLVRTAHDGMLHIDTQMHRVLGAPTVMVAGMTPTTVNERFVAAINNSGYHAELAGGGMHSEKAMERKINDLVKLVKPGQGITVNCIYVNQRQWSFQFPALLRLRAKGVPVVGLCIGGGVPSLDSAANIIDSLRAAGIRHVAFKPSTAEAIRHVVNIARAHADFPVVLQWTGGRAGGHHSFEDFHQPILETYATVRSCGNIVLVAGSGFGDAEGSLPYLTGDWSVDFGKAPMPFDGILLGSRVMVAKEAGTADAAKELIVAASGLSDAEWHKTYNGPSGGILTVTSEYGELNHVLATRATLLCKDLGDTILSQPREKHASLLLARKDEIIARLNSDYMRPWFGRKADGRVVDLEDMTYAEVVSRLVELMYVKHQQRWIDKTYHRLLFDFIIRAECRLGTDLPELTIVPDIQDLPPTELALAFSERYPAAESQLLHSEDIQFFISICKRRGQKPVPFIPVLDGDFGTMFQKDSIWQSEDLDTVVDQDPQRVGIQQGPVAARFSTTINEPVKDILDGVYQGHIAALLAREYQGDEANVPVVEYIGAQPGVAESLAHVTEQVTDTVRTYVLPNSQDQLPELSQWLDTIAGPAKSWLRALLTAPAIVEGSGYVDNYVKRVLRPRPGQVVSVTTEAEKPLLLEISNGSGTVELRVEYLAGHIDLTILHPSVSGIATLQYLFAFQPSRPLAPIHLIIDGHADRIRRLYAETWINNADVPAAFEDHTDPDAQLHSDGFIITEDHVNSFCQIVGNHSQHYLQGGKVGLRAPMEFLFLSSTPNTLRILSSTAFGDGQLSVVHLYNKIQLADGAAPLMVGNSVSSSLCINEVVNTESGKLVKILGVLLCRGQVVAHMETAFLSRNQAAPIDKVFQRKLGQRLTIQPTTTDDISALEAKEWFNYCDDNSICLTPGSLVEFCLDSEYRFKQGSVYSSISTTGRAYVKSPAGAAVYVADILLKCRTSVKDPVIEYLRRHEAPSDDAMFDGDGYSLVPLDDDTLTHVVVPDSNWEYADVAADGNPIHTNAYVASIVGLPGPITHGMWTSASTRALLECYAANDEPERIRMYQTNFVGIVLPEDQLRTELFHVGMKNGRMLVKGMTSKVGGEQVLECIAEVEQPTTAYLFTGQGSQEVGMGMGLYSQSAAARSVWDRAERHMVDKYGVSLLTIVRTNPKELTVHFASEIGEDIQRNYMSFSRGNGKVGDVSRLFPDITPDSQSYTYRSPTGLLNATQFTQIALITYAMAAVADMRAKSLIQEGAVFAGHSLGEYTALIAIGGLFSQENILDVIFYRGMLMQSAVERDSQGRSQYGMVAVDPSRIGKTVSENVLALVIEAIRIHGQELLEVVNFNVHGLQCVVAGTLRQLSALRLVLDSIARQGAPAEGELPEHITNVVSSVFAQPIDSKPVRGRATIPLSGIDIPFHSSQLLPGVDEFRALLQAKILPERVNYSALCDRYIPNLTAVPFEVSRQYFELVHGMTGSPVAANVLDSWSDAALERADEVTKLAAALLVELLAYQFASPVQWIDTQDVLLNKLGVHRLVEIGVSPVLSGMAAKTLKSAAHAGKRVEVLHNERDKDTIYYTQQIRDAAESTIAPQASSLLPAQPEQTILPVVAPVAAAVAESTTPAVLAPIPSSSSAPLVDVPLQALDVIHSIVAHKTKHSLADVSVQRSIKSMVGGKSTLQNEIVGDLHKELGSKIPDKAEDLSLQDLAAAVGALNGGLGKYSQAQLARLFSNKMPGGFSLSTARSTLQSAYGVGVQRQDALLLVALTMEPADRLTSDAEAKAWLDTAAQAYAAKAGISYSAAAGSGSGSGGLGGQAGAPVINSAEMEKMQLKQHEHIRQQIQVLARYAGIDLREGARLAEGEQARAADLQTKIDSITAELGDELIDGVQPMFDTRKARHYDSCWNWARQEAYEVIQQAIISCAPGSHEAPPASIDAAGLQRLQNCSSPGLLQMISGMLSVLQATGDPSLGPAVQLVSLMHGACSKALAQPPVYRELSTPTGPKVEVGPDGTVAYSEVPRPDEPSFMAFVEHMRQPVTPNTPPYLHLKKQATNNTWAYCTDLSATYFESLSEICGGGLSFAGKTALVTGCGHGSIGANIVSSLLSGGAKVVATTSSYSRKTTLFFEDMYRTHGARGSELIVVPFNQGSARDIWQLVDYIYNGPEAAKGLGWDLDYVFPFGAVPDIGSFATNLGSRSELSQRVLLTNVLRLLGCIKDTKERLGLNTRSSLVVLPLSPNHGVFGGDGLYGECKLGLETAFNRWKSESWKNYLSIAGAVIGWTRGTGLMTGNNMVSSEIEKHGMRTFSTREMAFSILGLAHSRLCRIACKTPIWANLSGGMGSVGDLSNIAGVARQTIRDTSSRLSVVSREAALDHATQHLQPSLSMLAATQGAAPLAKSKHHFPAPRQYEQLEHLHHLQGMVNLDKVVVVTGYGEVSPHGNAETRWEMEAYGEFSLEGCIELAWVMGLIKHVNGTLNATGSAYTGWVDAKTEEPVRDVDVKPRYEEYILAHTGIRLIEPELSAGYNPNGRSILREIQIEHDMEPFEASGEDAQAFKSTNGENVDIWEGDSGSWSVRFRKGALIRVPMALRGDRLVAGQIPTGWSPTRYGIPEDVAKQVDPVTCYTLVATVEALVRSGITDPYELYQYFHVSEVGNTTGSGIGGGSSLQRIFKHRALDIEVRSDILQETFISTVQAWVNMLLMSSSGPVKPLVGACATGVLSIDVAIETIQSGKARVMLAGGVDEFFEESSIEFASMGATSNSLDEFAKGRIPSEMCRPCTSTRSGFMEAQGAGIVTLMSASAAIDFGAPIYGIIAMSGTATDKQGRSVPAPGKGVLTSTRETSGGLPSRLLNIGYRRRQLERQLASLDAWKQEELAELADMVDNPSDSAGHSARSYAKQIEGEYAQQRRGLLDLWGNEFWKNKPDISPLRGCLAVWGLTVDDIGMASFHGTSTAANDKNESDVLNSQFHKLGRTPGHTVPVVCQKWLTGHPKGPAASFMLNGVLQSLRTGLVPGNRNADNIDKAMEEFCYALYLSKSVQTSGIKAGLLKSFGFGQVGAELLVVHADYLFATLTQDQLGQYNVKLQQRDVKASRYWQDTLVGSQPFVQVKSRPPYTAAQEKSVYLDPLARAKYDKASGEYKF